MYVLLKKKSFLFIVIFSITNISFADYQEGIDYKIVNEGKSNFVKGIDNEIKIIEAFWYGCPHCYKFEKYLEKWKPSLQKDVFFSKVPAAFNKYWALHAKVFYSIEKYKNKDKIHNLIFKAIHEQNRNLDNYQSIETFLKAQNINTSKLNKNFNSDKINEKVEDANYIAVVEGGIGPDVLGLYENHADPKVDPQTAEIIQAGVDRNFDGKIEKSKFQK